MIYPFAFGYNFLQSDISKGTRSRLFTPIFVQVYHFNMVSRELISDRLASIIDSHLTDIVLEIDIPKIGCYYTCLLKIPTVYLTDP